MNTSLDTHCGEATFQQLITQYLVKEVGVANPYQQGCNTPAQSYLNASSSIARYSYKGGHMDEQLGVWIPDTYGACDADNQSIADDVNRLSEMLAAYQKVFPHATFTLVGHSLGGLVALQGAYHYTMAQHHTGIVKVITLDSPLDGLFVTQQAAKWSQWSSALCTVLGKPVGNVVFSDLVPLGKVSFLSPLCVPNQGYPTIQAPLVISQCAARALATAGVGVVTLGNDKDNLFCQPAWISQIGQVTEKACETQVLLSEITQYWHLYSYSTPYSTPNPSETDKIAHDHSTLLVTPGVEQDVIRFLLAPVVSVTQPALNSSAWFNGTDTPLHFSATVHCLWGQVNHAEAVVHFADMTILSAGVFKPNYSGFSLSLQGTTILPANAPGDTATFSIKAGGDACGYPKTVSADAIPSDTDYLYGLTRGVPFSLDGGKLAAAESGSVYASRSQGNSLGTPAISYNDTSVQYRGNTVEDVAWSPDGTQLAYLVATSALAIDTATEDLYVASSNLQNPRKLASNLPGAMAITWNHQGDTIAVFEENEGNGPQPITLQFTPSIVLMNANSGTLTKRISLPTSANLLDGECGIASYCAHAPRTGIQWAANGTFLLTNSNAGTVLVFPNGQSRELETGRMWEFNSAPLGALSEDGTQLAYPDRSGTVAGPTSIQLYQVDATSGGLSNPEVLATVTDGSDVAFSPDGRQIAACMQSSVILLDTGQPGNPKRLASFPGQGLASCEDLRWSPDGRSLAIRMGQQGGNGGTIGLVIVPLAVGQPQILFSCGLTYTTSFQFTETFTMCPYGVVFDWQPLHAG